LKFEVSKETIKTIKEKIQIRKVRGRRNKCERKKRKRKAPRRIFLSFTVQLIFNI